MTNLWKSGIIFLLIIAGLYIIFLRECKHTPSDEITIKKSVWDSIKALANKPPTIKIDTFWRKGNIVYVPAKPLPNPIPNKDSTINTYKDSLINKEINVWVNDKVKGRLLERSWNYKPISKEILVVKTVYVPKIIDNPVPYSQRGFYIYGIAGGNANLFLFGGGLDFITKKNTVLGGMYQRYGNDNVYSVKLGFKLGK